MAQPTAYQRVNSAYDVTESGVATCHYVQYDGSDDSMSTAAIDFTATDKMSVFAGVRILSTAATSVLAETSVGVGSNSGSFALMSPDSSVWRVYLNGGGNLVGVSSPATAPVSAIQGAVFDIAGTPEAALRINGAQVASGSSGATGNFGNYPLYIGRRGGASLPFNGKDYGIIVVGKAASAGEITDTETWLAAKTAQVTI